jgi:hypothetical protein
MQSATLSGKSLGCFGEHEFMVQGISGEFVRPYERSDDFGRDFKASALVWYE